MENYLQKMFIDQATPALKRHSGGGGSGGGGSGGFIEVDELPTTNVQDDVLYKVVKSEPVIEIKTEYVEWDAMDYGDGLEIYEGNVFYEDDIVDSLDEVVNPEPYKCVILRGTGSIYINFSETSINWRSLSEVIAEEDGLNVPDRGYITDPELITEPGMYIQKRDISNVISRGEAIYGVSIDDNSDNKIMLSSENSWKSYISLFVEKRNCNALFYMCQELTNDTLNELLLDLDTSKATNMNSMFNYCQLLTTIPLLDTKWVNNMSSMFYMCTKLKTIPLLDTKNVTDMRYMFYGCSLLTTIPLLDTKNVANMRQMFCDCYSLTTVPPLDVRGVTDMSGMFGGCSRISDIRLKNIKANLTVGSGDLYGKSLTLDSLISLIYELIDMGVTRTLTIGTYNVSRIMMTFVKLIDITDEMRAEDPFIDQKLPFIVCNSTDEGAIQISNYVSAKNWALA